MKKNLLIISILIIFIMILNVNITEAGYEKGEVLINILLKNSNNNNIINLYYVDYYDYLYEDYVKDSSEYEMEKLINAINSNKSSIDNLYYKDYNEYYYENYNEKNISEKIKQNVRGKDGVQPYLIENNVYKYRQDFNIFTYHDPGIYLEIKKNNEEIVNYTYKYKEIINSGIPISLVFDCESGIIEDITDYEMIKKPRKPDINNVLFFGIILIITILTIITVNKKLNRKN